MGRGLPAPARLASRSEADTCPKYEFRTMGGEGKKAVLVHYVHTDGSPKSLRLEAPMGKTLGWLVSKLGGRGAPLDSIESLAASGDGLEWSGALKGEWTLADGDSLVVGLW